MPYLILPPRSIRQPLYRPKIRQSSDLARGLIFATPTGRFDAVSGRSATLVGQPDYSTQSGLNGDLGFALTAASSQALEFPLPGAGMLRPFSLGIVVNATDNGAADGFISLADTALNGYYAILGRGDLTGNPGQVATWNGALFRAYQSGSTVYASRLCIVASFPAGTQPVMNLWINGDNSGTTNPSTQNASILTATRILLGATASGGARANFAGARSSAAFVWNYEVDVSLAGALTRDNWAVFAPDTRRYFLAAPPASAGFKSRYYYDMAA